MQQHVRNTLFGRIPDRYKKSWSVFGRYSRDREGLRGPTMTNYIICMPNCIFRILQTTVDLKGSGSRMPPPLFASSRKPLPEACFKTKQQIGSGAFLLVLWTHLLPLGSYVSYLLSTISDPRHLRLSGTLLDLLLLICFAFSWISVPLFNGSARCQAYSDGSERYV